MATFTVIGNSVDAAGHVFHIRGGDVPHCPFHVADPDGARYQILEVVEQTREDDPHVGCRLYVFSVGQATQGPLPSSGTLSVVSS